MPKIETYPVSGEEIEDIVFNTLMPAVNGRPIPVAILGMLTLSAIIMEPDITPDRLRDVVEGTSEYLVTAIAPINPAEAN